MKYDLIIVGGGPGGLMAAKTAAEDGLKVILVERKKNITQINRSCVQVFYIRKLSPNKKQLHADGYIEPVSLEVTSDTYRFHFPGPGFSLDYNGPLKPYYNWIEVSPSKYLIYPRKHNIWGYIFDKEAFLAGLLSSAQKVGAEIWSETIAMGADNTPDGVKVRVRGKSGEQTLEARVAIVADGVNSTIVDGLGLNKKRKVVSPPIKLTGYELEGVETDLPAHSWLSICIPSVSRLMTIMTIMMGELPDDKHVMLSILEEDLQRFMKHPNFTHWFRHARVVKKTAVVSGAKYGLLTAIREPVEGNIVIVGDAAAIVETWVQGAVASAYRAVKAIEKELSGQKGYSEYIDWWQKAFYMHNPDYLWGVYAEFAVSTACTCDEDVDYIYKLFQDKEARLPNIISENLELIKEGRPELYERLKKGFEEAEKVLLRFS